MSIQFRVLKLVCATTVAGVLAVVAGGDSVVTAGPQNTARATAPQSDRSYDVAEKGITDLQADMTAGRVSAVQLVELYQRRIAAYDQAGPRLNAVLHLNPRAAAEARALDAERKQRGPRGPLHGIPVLLKDNFETKDMPTTGGSTALAGMVPLDDAFQVRKLGPA